MNKHSKAALRSIEPALGTLKAVVLDCIIDHGPMTDEDIARKLGANPNTTRPRRIDLARSGRIQKAGEGLTRSGCTAALWVAQQ